MPKDILPRIPEAAHEGTLCSGTERNVRVVLRVGFGLPPSATASGTLGLSGPGGADGHRSRQRPPGEKAADAAVRKRGRPRGTKAVLNPAEARLLALLDRPRHGAKLPALLGVTRQRIHQLVGTLSALDLVRSADPDYPGFALARKDDPSTLLRPDQEHVLSAFPRGRATTTLPRIAAAARMSRAQAGTILEALSKAGLVEKAEVTIFGDSYRLTADGAAHWQRSPTAPRALIAGPPLPFRSDRIRNILSLLADQGPTRTRDIGLELGVAPPSLNALMQYLKRKKAVRTQSDVRGAPYELTPDGREMVAAMQRWWGTPARRDPGGGGSQ
jgi:DNA-binding IclR family transcriptional regulator